MLSTFLILIVMALLFSAMSAFLYLQIKKLGEVKKDDTLLEWTKATQNDIKELQNVLHDTLTRSNLNMTQTLQQNTKEIHDRLNRAAEVIGDLKKEAGAFSEVGRSMRDLQDFLNSPKLRGNIGEKVLNDLVSQVFPKQKFMLQYRFKTGSTVDVALQTDAGILCVDSKFPAENFNKMMKLETEKEREAAKKEFVRDVKKHIDAISSKYILPEEGTMDFALMYVPSEAVFYEVANDTSLMEYARLARVYVVSPTTLYAHLQTILLSFEGRRMESKTKEVLKMLRAIQTEYGKVEGQMNTLGRHVTNAYNSVASANSSISQLGQKISTAASLTTKEEDEQQLLEN